jgi:Protein of unknown function (DUF2490)
MKFVSIFGLLISSFHLSAQPGLKQVVTQPTEWFVLNSAIKFHKKVGFTFDGQLRFVRGLENAQHFVRNGLEIYITPKLSIVPIGYMYVWNFRYGEQPTTYANNEQRIWQQLLYRHSISKFLFSHRFRMEQRFIEKRYADASGMIINDGFDTYLNRIRYRLQVQFPLNKEKIESGALFAVVSDEIFYSWGSTVTFSHPDQNRIYVALGYQFNKSMNFQSGGFYQALIKNNGTLQENNIGVMTQFTYNFDFYKKTD